MKKTIKLLGFIALVAVIGFSIAACGGGADGGGDDPGGNTPGGQTPGGTIPGGSKITITLKWSRNIDKIHVYDSTSKRELYNASSLYTPYETFVVDIAGISKIDVLSLSTPDSYYGQASSARKDNISVVPGKYYTITISTQQGTGLNSWFVFDITESTPSHGGGDITYTAVPNSTTSTAAVNLAFSVPVYLTANNITITNGTGAVTKGTLTGDLKDWSLRITVNTPGNITVKINKSGIENGDKTVTVAKDPGGGDNDKTFTSIAAFNTWLKEQPNNQKTAPYNIKLNVNDLSNIGSVLGNSIYSNIYVNLDLSGSTFTGIGQNAFSDCVGLTGVIIPGSVTTIGGQAFRRCANLASITIPDSVTTIWGSAFSGCTSLTSVTIPNGITTIVSGTFYGCTKLTGITIPNSVTTIGSEAFRECTGLTSITIPDSVTSIEGGSNGAFADCTGLTSVTIGNGVTGLSGFIRCTGLTSVTIGNSVTSIWEYAFNGCTKLTGITIPDTVTSIGDFAFSGCTGLTGITIPSSVTSIRRGAFSGCNSLTGVTFEGAITASGFANDTSYPVFPGDLRAKYLAGGAGTYTRSGVGTTSSPYVWTKN